MNSADVLDVVERLHTAAGHPDIVQIRRYGRDNQPGGLSQAGVALRYPPGSEAYLWATEGGKAVPVALDRPTPPPRYRAERALRFLIQLLDAAKPAQFTAWRTVAFPDLGLPQPCGLELKCADGTSFWLRVTAGGGQFRDPDEDERPDYAIPAGISAQP